MSALHHISAKWGFQQISKKDHNFLKFLIPKIWILLLLVIDLHSNKKDLTLTFICFFLSLVVSLHGAETLITQSLQIFGKAMWKIFIVRGFTSVNESPLFIAVGKPVVLVFLHIRVPIRRVVSNIPSEIYNFSVTTVFYWWTIVSHLIPSITSFLPGNGLSTLEGKTGKNAHVCFLSLKYLLVPLRFALAGLAHGTFRAHRRCPPSHRGVSLRSGRLCRGGLVWPWRWSAINAKCFGRC